MGTQVTMTRARSKDGLGPLYGTQLRQDESQCNGPGARFAGRSGCPEETLVHGAIQVIEELVVGSLTFFLGETERFDALDENFFGVGLGFEDLHDFSNEVGEGHSAGIPVLLLAHQLSLDVRRNELEDLDAGVTELIAEGLRPGMDSGFGGAVGGRHSERQKGQARADGHNGGVRLLLEVGKQGGGEVEGREEIDFDDGVDGLGVVRTVGKVLGLHDAGVIDEDVERGELAGDVGCEGDEGVA
jgi:hypothetical protein